MLQVCLTSLPKAAVGTQCDLRPQTPLPQLRSIGIQWEEQPLPDDELEEEEEDDPADPDYVPWEAPEDEDDEKEDEEQNM